MTILLRDYQDAAIKNLFTYFKIAPGKRPLVVAPTGSGKSVLIAATVQKCLNARPSLNIIILTHMAELLTQNCSKLLEMMPEKAKDISFYCDSLNEKKISQITLASIQSIYEKAEAFRAIGVPNILLVDECHLIPKRDTSMYQSFIAGLKAINPSLGVIGFTATPFRTDSGLLIEGEDKIFDDVCYDISIAELISKKFHAKLISKHSQVQADLSKVKARGGDFILKDLEDVMNQNPLTVAAVNEMVKWGADRKKWLIFCAGVKHAERVRDEIRSRGISSETICGETPKDERARILEDFRAGRLSSLTNHGVLTTGYDEPEIDLVALLRGTKSAGLYMQMVGRGSRIHPKKENCLVLDFGGNIERFGPIDCITIRKNKGKAKIDQLPTKKCPSCGNVLPISFSSCECGHVFEKLVKDHEAEASSRPVLNEPVDMVVYGVAYKRHKKEGKPDSLRVDYTCDMGRNNISEFICLEHDGFARHKAFLWWHMHVDGVWEDDLPTVENAILNQHRLLIPKTIKAVKDGKFWRILSTEFWGKGEEVVMPTSREDEFYADTGINL